MKLLKLPPGSGKKDELFPLPAFPAARPTIHIASMRSQLEGYVLHGIENQQS
jgi:hypothetical protein